MPSDLPSQDEGSDQVAGATGAAVPIFVYLYYLVFDQDPTIPVATRAYFCFDYLAGGHTDSDLRGLISRFVANGAVDGDRPPAYGSSFDELVRRRKGYIVVAVDAPNLQLDPAHPITFSGEFDGVPNDARHTLTAPTELRVPVQNPARQVSAFYMGNGMNEPDMTDLDDREVERFNYTLAFTKSGEIKNEEPRSYPDSGGTNMGPPIGPPYLIQVG